MMAAERNEQDEIVQDVWVEFMAELERVVGKLAQSHPLTSTPIPLMLVALDPCSNSLSIVTTVEVEETRELLNLAAAAAEEAKQREVGLDRLIADLGIGPVAPDQPN